MKSLPSIRYSLLIIGDALEASIAMFTVAKEGDVTLPPSPLIKKKRLVNKYSFAVGKVLPLAPPCMYKVGMRASSKALEALIDVVTIEKEGDVTLLPSPFIKNRRLGNGYLFAMGNVLPCATPPCIN